MSGTPEDPIVIDSDSEEFTIDWDPDVWSESVDSDEDEDSFDDFGDLDEALARGFVRPAA